MEIENGRVAVGVQGQSQTGYGVGAGDRGGLAQMVRCSGTGLASPAKSHAIESNLPEPFLKGRGLPMKIWPVPVELKSTVGVPFFDLMNDTLASYVLAALQQASTSSNGLSVSCYPPHAPLSPSVTSNSGSLKFMLSTLEMPEKTPHHHQATEQLSNGQTVRRLPG